MLLLQEQLREQRVAALCCVVPVAGRPQPVQRAGRLELVRVGQHAAGGVQGAVRPRGRPRQGHVSPVAPVSHRTAA